MGAESAHDLHVTWREAKDFRRAPTDFRPKNPESTAINTIIESVASTSACTRPTDDKTKPTESTSASPSSSRQALAKALSSETNGANCSFPI